MFIFFFQAEDGIRDYKVTGVQTCALPIWTKAKRRRKKTAARRMRFFRSRGRNLCHRRGRSEEHTSELQSPCNLVCRLLLEKKKNEKQNYTDDAIDDQSSAVY